MVVGDPAFGGNRWNDRFVILVLGQDGHDHWYVMDAFADRVGPSRLEEACGMAVEWAHVYRARAVAMETHAKEAMANVMRTVMDRVRARVPLLNTVGGVGGRGAESKVDRILNHLGPHARGKLIHFCEDADWESGRRVERFRKILVQEALDYPSGRHDDCLDALSFGRQVFYQRREGVGGGVIRKIGPMRRRFIA